MEKKPITEERKYHHGNLKEAFIEAARDLLESNGLVGLSLRKCAERVGVSHTAPKNHFGNMAGLLTAIVVRGYAELAEMMVAELPDGATRDQRRQAALLGYISFAQHNPALYELMFSRDRLVNDDPALMQEIRACFIILADISKDLGSHAGTADEMAGKGQVALWSFVHGLAFLTIDGKLAEKKLDVDLEQVLREVALRVMEPLPG